MSKENPSAQFTLLRAYEHVHEAQLDYMKLKDEGLDPYLKNQLMVHTAPHYSNAVGGVQLMVPFDQVEQALQILSLENDQSGALTDLFPDADFEPVAACQACGSRDLFQGRSILSGLFSLIVFILPISLPSRITHCASCGHSWKT